MKFIYSIKFKIFFLIAITFSSLFIINFANEAKVAKKELVNYLNNLNSSSARLIIENVKAKLYNLDYSQIKDTINSFENTYFQDIYILNKEGYIFAQKSSDKIVLKKYENFDKLVKSKDKNDFIYFSQIRLADKHLGYLVIHNNQNIFIQSQNQRKKELLEVFLISLLTIIVLSFAISVIITKPINKIVDKIKNVNENESLNINYAGNDEFGYLTNIIEQNHNKIQDINKNLESIIVKELEKNKNIQDKLFKSEKLASMGEMIANIAHQWRQPLSAISAAATGMRLQQELKLLSANDIIDTCDKINKNAQYLSKTIDDFKNFIKGDRKREIFDLKDNIDSSLSIVYPIIKELHIKLILNLQDDIKLNGYPNELKQCIINIANNAKDILEEKVKDTDDRFIFINTAKEHKNAIITISDSGGGIPKDVIKRIFEPYFTTKYKTQGTGLGLHMVYTIIVTGMNGTIEAYNIDYEYDGKKYTGAQFKITLPLS